MNRLIVVFVSAIFLMTISVSATELEIYPETVEIDLVGGDFVQINIIISWSGSYSASCELTTHIEPDGEGINVTYSRNSFTMEPSSDNDIIMSINASLALAPGTYIITTNVNVETQEQSSNGNGNGGEDQDTSGGKTTIQDDDTVTEPDDEAPDDEGEEEDEFDYVLYTTTTAKDGRFLFWLFIIGLFIIMIFITLLYLISKRRKRLKSLETRKNENKNK